MPVLSLSVWEESLDERTETRLIESLTDAITATLGEQLREHVTVLIHPIPMRRWGAGGIPSSRFANQDAEVEEDVPTGGAEPAATNGA